MCQNSPEKENSPIPNKLKNVKTNVLALMSFVCLPLLPLRGSVGKNEANLTRAHLQLKVDQEAGENLIVHASVLTRRSLDRTNHHIIPFRLSLHHHFMLLGTRSRLCATRTLASAPALRTCSLSRPRPVLACAVQPAAPSPSLPALFCAHVASRALHTSAATRASTPATEDVRFSSLLSSSLVHLASRR